MTDFEDAVQAETAKQNDIGIIITRNKVDFKKCDIEVLTPEEFIRKQLGTI